MLWALNIVVYLNLVEFILKKSFMDMIIVIIVVLA